jgi:hypothetical protein
MSRFTDALDPNNLRLLFASGWFMEDLVEDLREDLSFARIVGREVFRTADKPPKVDLASVFPKFRERPLRALRGRRIGIVASGGSGATAALCGVKRAFEEAGLEAAAISACSGSMLFCSLWASGLSAQEMAEFWLTLKGSEYMDPGWRQLARAGFRGFRDFGGLMLGEAVERTYRGRLGDLRLGKTRVPLHVVAWNVGRNQLEYLGTRTTPGLAVARAVRAAISIPLFVEPVRIGRHLYGDGGVVSIFIRLLVDYEKPSTPWWRTSTARRTSAERTSATEAQALRRVLASGSSVVRVFCWRGERAAGGDRLTLFHLVPYEGAGAHLRELHRPGQVAGVHADGLPRGAGGVGKAGEEGGAIRRTGRGGARRRRAPT